MEPILPSQPWRLLILDREPDDPRWLIATVAREGDVRPAHLDADGRYTDWPEVTAWVTTRLGEATGLAPMNDALAWQVQPARRRSR